MMEVNQPLATSALKLKTIGSIPSGVQNGSDGATAKAASGSNRSREAIKGVEDDTMERLTFDLDDDVSEDKPDGTDTVQNISDSLVEDIVQLSKQKQKENGVILIDGLDDASSDLPPLSSEDATTATELEAVASGDGKDDLDEHILLEEDDAEIGDDIPLDEIALLGEEEDENVAAPEVLASRELTEADSSIAAVDESGLSILNTAAVDITDMVTDESVKLDELAPVAAESSVTKESAEKMVASVAGIVKLREDGEDNEGNLDLTDLIKFPDLEKTSGQEMVPEEDDTVVEEGAIKSKTPEMSDLMEFDSAVADGGATKTVDADGVQDEDSIGLSDFLTFPAKDIDSENKDDEKKGEKVSDKKETADEQGAKSAEEATNADESASETLKDPSKEDPSDDIDDASLQAEACPQALQAADEEDLLEMMEEPERMEADDDQPEDDNSSESGSAQRANGDEEDDFEGSDYMAGEEEDGGRIAEEQEDGATDAVTENLESVDQTEDNDEDGPPSKRRCSVDVRETSELEIGGSELSAEDKPNEAQEEKVLDSEADKLKPTAVEEKEDVPTGVEEGETKIAEEATKDEAVISESESKTVEADPDVIEIEPETVEPDSETSKADSNTTKDVGKPAEAETLPAEGDKTDSADSEPIVSVENSEKAPESEPSKMSNDAAGEKDETSEEKSDTAKVKEPKKSSDDAVPTEGEPAKEELDTSKSKSEEAGKETYEIFVIDDDDEPEPETKVKTKQENDSTLAGKRPCPKDEAESKDQKEAVKKIRLSVDDDVQLEAIKVEGKKNDPSETKVDIKKVELAEKVKQEDKKPIEPIKINLDPEPAPPKEKKPIRLDFMEKFKKPLEKMNRTDLEQFVLQKIVEGVAFKSTIAEMRTQLEAQDQLLQGYRQKVHDLNKQFKDLEMVHERVVKDLEKKNQHFITPVKITRAVGLQVSQPRFATATRPSIGTANATPISPKGTVVRSPVSTPTPGSSPSKTPLQNSIINRRQSYSKPSPAVNNVKNHMQQVSNRTTIQQVTVKNITTGVATNSSLNKSISSAQTTVVNGTAASNSSPQPAQQSPAQQSQSAAASSAATTPNNNAVTPTIRKKPLQKFTPMRPPLSFTQQVQQQHATRQLQEQLVRQQIQEVQTNTSGSGSPSTGSPLTQSPLGSPAVRSSESPSTPVTNVTGRVPPIVVKKVTPQTKGAPGTMQIVNRQSQQTLAANVRTPPTTPTATSSPAVIDNSLIDLTDEDDAPKPTPVAVSQATVVAKPPITVLNGQPMRPAGSMPPLVVINQQRLVGRPTLAQRPSGTVLNGAQAGTRPILLQRPANPANGFPRTVGVQQAYKARMINGQMDRRLITRPPVRQQTPISYTHPAPLPLPTAQVTNPSWKQSPPRPSIRINNIETGIVISWTMDDLSEGHATIVSYQIYAYQETTAPPSMDMWRHVGDVKAMLLPMAVTLTQFQEGQRYHFAVRAVDEHQRVGHFSPPRTWNESAPNKA